MLPLNSAKSRAIAPTSDCTRAKAVEARNSPIIRCTTAASMGTTPATSWATWASTSCLGLRLNMLLFPLFFAGSLLLLPLGIALFSLDRELMSLSGDAVEAARSHDGAGHLRQQAEQCVNRTGHG